MTIRYKQLINSININAKNIKEFHITYRAIDYPVDYYDGALRIFKYGRINIVSYKIINDDNCPVLCIRANIDIVDQEKDELHELSRLMDIRLQENGADVNVFDIEYNDVEVFPRDSNSFNLFKQRLTQIITNYFSEEGVQPF